MKFPLISRHHKFILAIAVSLAGLAVTYIVNLHFSLNRPQFLGTHTLVELVTIFVSFTVVGIVWFLRDGLDDYQGKFILMLGLNFFAVGSLDLFHTLSYEGMPDIITPASSHKATVFWFFARYWGAGAFLFVLAYGRKLIGIGTRELANRFIIVNTLLGSFLCFIAATWPDTVPPLINAAGLTWLKIFLETLLVLLYALALAQIWRLKKNGISETVLIHLGYFLIFSVFAELSFTMYSTVYDMYNLAGHIYKLAAYYFLFQAVYCSGVINNLYTLGEMAKMSADLLQQEILLEPIISVQMNKLKKILPQVERIAVYISEAGGQYYRANYVWGRFSDRLPAGHRCRMNLCTEQFGAKSIILDDPMDLLQIYKVEGHSTDIPIDVPLVLNETKQLMYIPLVSGSEHFGIIIIYTFSPLNNFSADDLDKAQVFQHFATLAIAQAKSQEIISRLSFEDSLTGLPNRRGFFNELQIIKTQAKSSGDPYTIIFADMNGLKFVNDNLGHAAGDQALKLIGKLLLNECGKLGTAARLGGDEFAIAYQCMGMESAAATTQGLRQRFSAIKLPEYDVMFSLAIGAATFPQEADDEENLIKLADDRMYEHKRQMKQAGPVVKMLTQN